MESEFSALRKALKFTKSEVAHELGLHPVTVFQWKETPPLYAMKYLRLLKKLLDAEAKIARMGEMILELSRGRP